MTFSMTHNQVTENSEVLKIKPHTWLKKLKMLSRKKQKVLATFFDLSKAFDKVWKEGLLCKLSKCGVTRNLDQRLPHKKVCQS